MRVFHVYSGCESVFLDSPDRSRVQRGIAQCGQGHCVSGECRRRPTEEVGDSTKRLAEAEGEGRIEIAANPFDVTAPANVVGDLLSVVGPPSAGAARV